MLSSPTLRFGPISGQKRHRPYEWRLVKIGAELLQLIVRKRIDTELCGKFYLYPWPDQAKPKPPIRAAALGKQLKNPFQWRMSD